MRRAGSTPVTRTKTKRGSPKRGAPFGFGAGTEPNPHANKTRSLALGTNAWGKDGGLRE